MDKKEFWIKPPEKPKSAFAYLREELRGDFELFAEEMQPAIEVFIRGETADPAVISNAQKAINTWWQDKYGFPFSLVDARNEVLMRKYAQDKTKYESALLIRLLKAMAENNEVDTKKAKDEYKENYPEELEGLSVILAMRNFFRKSKSFNEEGGPKNSEERMKVFRDFTEYQFLFTHFIVSNNQDKDFLEIFWKVAREIAEKEKAIKELNMLQRGQLSQVASFRIAKLLGFNPRISHPDEDAFNAIDLWAESDVALQITGSEEETPQFISSDYFPFPAIEIKDGLQKSRMLFSQKFVENKASKFLAKVDKYARHTGRDIKGYMLVIPYSKIDFITGEPAPELVEFFKDKIETHEAH
jgi:hypothetical protein